MELNKTFGERVVFSIDVGATYSALSHLYVKPEDTLGVLLDKVVPIKRWPNHPPGVLSIPSRMVYEKGIPVAYGRKAIRPKSGSNRHLVEEFKRHIHRFEANPVSDRDRAELKPLPVNPDVAIDKVYEDWLTYLFEVGKKDFLAKNPSVSENSKAWKDRICVFVVANGWSEPEQAQFRCILVSAKCVTHEKNIRFARESEATLHYFLLKNKASMLTSPVGLDFIVCNAGKATTDIARYELTTVTPLHYKEVGVSSSIEVGYSPEEATSGYQKNEEGGGNIDESVVDDIQKIIQAISEMINATSKGSKYIVLAGGLGRDPLTQSKLREEFRSRGVEVIVPEKSANDETPHANVDGALYSGLINYITTRAAQYTFGCEILFPYNAAIPEHNRRRKITGLHYVGDTPYLSKHWLTIVKEGDYLSDGETRGKDLIWHFEKEPSDPAEIKVTLFASSDPSVEWAFEGDGATLTTGVRQICQIIGKLPTSEMKIDKKTTSRGAVQYDFGFRVEVEFASVTSRAKMIWTDKKGKQQVTHVGFEPIPDTETDWSTNEWHRDLHSGQPSRAPTPQPIPKDWEAIEPAVYKITAPRHPRGSDFLAYWYDKGDEVKGKRDDYKDNTRWIVEGGEQFFKIRVKNQKTNSPVYAGFRAPPSHGSLVTLSLEGRKEWYRKKVPNSSNLYYILSREGGLCWTMESEGDGPRVKLQKSEPDHSGQWWGFAIENY